MKKINNKELLRKYKRLCRKIIYTIHDDKDTLEEAKKVENELIARFKETGLLGEFEKYQELIFNPVDTILSDDETLDKYYDAIIDLESKLS